MFLTRHSLGVLNVNGVSRLLDARLTTIYVSRDPVLGAGTVPVYHRSRATVVTSNNTFVCRLHRALPRNYLLLTIYSLLSTKNMRSNSCCHCIVNCVLCVTIVVLIGFWVPPRIGSVHSFIMHYIINKAVLCIIVYIQLCNALLCTLLCALLYHALLCTLLCALLYHALLCTLLCTLLYTLLCTLLCHT